MIDKAGSLAGGPVFAGRWAARCIQLAITGALVGWIIHSINADVWHAVWTVPLPALGTIIVVFAAAQVLGGLRLAALLPHELSCREAMAATWAGYFWANFLPGTVGGDIARVLRLRAAGIALAKATGAIVLDRSLNLIALVAIMLVTAMPLTRVLLAAVGTQWRVLAGLLTGAAAAGFALALCIRIEGFRARLIRGIAPLRGLIEDPLRLGWTLLLSGGSIGVSIMAQWLLAQTLGIAIGLSQLAGIICAVTLFAILPISLNGLGMQEASFVVLMTGAGVPAGAALSYSLLVRVLIVGTSLIAGVFVLIDRFIAARPRSI